MTRQTSIVFDMKLDSLHDGDRFFQRKCRETMTGNDPAATKKDTGLNKLFVRDSKKVTDNVYQFTHHCMRLTTKIFVGVRRHVVEFVD